MQKTYFHNNKSISESKVKKKTIPLQYIDQKRIVDINKLLNRVKLDRKIETKKIQVMTTKKSVCLVKKGYKVENLMDFPGH